MPGSVCVLTGYHSVRLGGVRGYDSPNQTTTFIGRSFLSCPISTAVIAVAVAADAAAASTTNEALYYLALYHLILPLGAGLWVAARASAVSQLVAVQQQRCSSGDRRRAIPELAVLPYRFRSGRTDLGVEY